VRREQTEVVTRASLVLWHNAGGFLFSSAKKKGAIEMKKTKKAITLILSLALCLGLLAACGNNGSEPEPTPTPTTEPTPTPTTEPEPDPEPEPDLNLDGDELEHFTIGVIQLMDHQALIAAYDGFLDSLAANGFVEGENLTILFDNAHGDIDTIATIADRFVTHNVDLVLAISTPATQAIAARTDTIPIIGTAVTSFEVAGVIDSNELPGGNVTGASDMNPVSAQIDLLVELVPDVETIGLVFNSGEDNSVLQIEMAKVRIRELGLSYHEATVTGTGDVMQAMQSLVGRVEAFYIPTDNTLASAMPTVHTIAMEAGLPSVIGEANMVLAGGLATMGINYYDLGVITGEIAAEVLRGADPGQMPIRFAADSDEILINGLVAEEIGFEVPERFLQYVVWPD
jgi:putative ABC transport system substrate-binding protein